MGELNGKVALVTGAARGQGRADAVRLAEEGADILAIDVCGPLEWNVADPATEADMAETARLIESMDRRIAAFTADVRDYSALKAAVESGVRELGRLDIVVANAGAWSYGQAHELTEGQWGETIDVCLTGVWNTCRATVPILIEQGCGGSIIIITSTVAIKAFPNLAHYVAAKHGASGLMKSLALELAPHWIRVNSVNPGTCNTPLIHNAATYRLFLPDVAEPTNQLLGERTAATFALPVPWVEPEDVANAVAFLASDRARCITGAALPVDGGVLVK